MAYVMFRVYSGPGASEIDRILSLAMKELALKISEHPGLIRYSPILFSDGRYGSFSAFHNPEAARRSTQIAAEWVKATAAYQGSKLDELMEGEVVYAVQGPADKDEGLYATARIYRSEAPPAELKAALEGEADGIVRSLPGLGRYTVAKLTDGRVGSFSAFDSPEHAKQSTEKLGAARAKSGSQLARVLPSDPVVIDGKVLATHRG